MTARAGDKVLARLRRVCLAKPGTSETASWGHPNFRTGKRVFAAFEWIKGRPSIALRLDAAIVDLLLSQHEHCFATPYGRGLWISFRADAPLDWGLLDDLVESAWRDAAPTPKRSARTGARAKPAAGRRSKRR